MKPGGRLKADQIEELAVEFAKRTVFEAISKDYQQSHVSTTPQTYVSLFFEKLDDFLTELEAHNAHRQP